MPQRITTVKEVIHSDIHKQIDYEWGILGECYQKKFIRGMYSSLERLLKLYKQRDIKF